MMLNDVERPPHFHTVSRLMQLVRKFRHAPGDLYDAAYRELESALYDVLDGKQPAQKEGFLYSIGQEVTHLKTKGRYVIVSTDTILEAERCPAYGYCRADGSNSEIYVRSKSEMEDGRFVKSN